VALATAAAPTYFPVHTIGDAQFVDGGLVANSPELVAVNVALREFTVDVNDVHVLAVGTASNRIARVKLRRTNRGLLFWGLRAVELTLAAQQALAVQLAKSLLGDRYLLLNQEPSPKQARTLGLDNASAKATTTLRLLADEAVAAVLNDPPRLQHLRRLTSHRPTIR
jgi:uncharacterized protein